MTDIFENLSACVWFEGGDRRNPFTAIIAGILFFSGWWFMIDAAFVYSECVHGVYFFCGILGTLSFFMINSVTDAQVRGESFSGGSIGQRGAVAWLYIGFVLGFAALIASCGILFANYFGKSKCSKEINPGISILVQNLFIFSASLVYKFGRTEDTWG